MNQPEMVEYVRELLWLYRLTLKNHVVICLNPEGCVMVARLQGRIESWEIALAMMQELSVPRSKMLDPRAGMEFIGFRHPLEDELVRRWVRRQPISNN